MEYLYDMGYLINRSMYRVLKNEKYLYEQSTRKFTEEELKNVSLMAEETYKDVCTFLKSEFIVHGFTGNTFTLCFDDKEFQLRPDYKKRLTPAFNKELKKTAQQMLLQIPETPRFKKVVGYGLEADDWIYNLRLRNSGDGKQSCIYTSDCDLLCNIDSRTAGIFCKARVSNEITKDTWDAAIGSVFCHEIPYNTIWLYKITVGDTSDHIAGVTRFGEKAFDKMINSMRQAELPLHTLGSMRGFTAFLEHPSGLPRYLNETQYMQAMEAWKLVSPITIEQAKILSQEPGPGIAASAAAAITI